VGAKIARIEEPIEQQMRPFQDAVNRGLTIKHRLPWTLVAEVGPTVKIFPPAADTGRLSRQQADRREPEERHCARWKRTLYALRVVGAGLRR